MHARSVLIGTCSRKAVVWLAAVGMLIACGDLSMAQEELGEQYFASFAGYELPLKLQERLSKADAESLGTYYVARRDASGRLREVRKIHKGEVFFVHEYVYDEAGALVEARITNKDGKISTVKRNREGRLVGNQ